MDNCWIGFGGNLGDVPARYHAVTAALQQHAAFFEVCGSALYRSVPMGANAGEPYWNAVIRAQTTLAPRDVLRTLHQLEDDHQRLRTVKWGPRTLDLDLLACGAHYVESTVLQLPHPGVWYRRFVLDPWQNLDPHWCHPVYRLTVAELRQRLVSHPPRLWLAGPWSPEFLGILLPHLTARWPNVICEPLLTPELPDSGILVATSHASQSLPRHWPRLTLSASGSHSEHMQSIVDVLTAAYEPPRRVDRPSRSEPTTAKDAVDEPHAQER